MCSVPTKHLLFTQSRSENLENKNFWINEHDDLYDSTNKEQVIFLARGCLHDSFS